MKLLFILLLGLGFTNVLDQHSDFNDEKTVSHHISHKEVRPVGVYLLITEDYEFEQVLVFNEDFEVQVFEKNYSINNEGDSPDLLESYKLYWRIQDSKFCFPLKTYPSGNVEDRYCQDYHIDENHLIFFEPGRGDEVEEIRFIKLSD